jgi:carboxyl-terminal processing protease
LTRKQALKNTLACGKKKKNRRYHYYGIPTTCSTSKSEETLLDKNQEEIKGLIIDEIIKRYQYQEGFINIL